MRDFGDDGFEGREVAFDDAEVEVVLRERLRDRGRRRVVMRRRVTILELLVRGGEIVGLS